MLGVQGTNPNSAYMAATYFEYHGIEPGAYYGLEYRRVSNIRSWSGSPGPVVMRGDLLPEGRVFESHSLSKLQCLFKKTKINEKSRGCPFKNTCFELTRKTSV